MKIIKNRSLILLVTTFCLGCELNNVDKDGIPGFTKIPCSNANQIDLEKHPKKIDSLIDQKVVEMYSKSKDTVLKYNIQGKVYYKMNLTDCKIDYSSYNAFVKVTTITKKEYYLFSFKKVNKDIKIENIEKNPLGNNK